MANSVVESGAGAVSASEAWTVADRDGRSFINRGTRMGEKGCAAIAVRHFHSGRGKVAPLS